MRLVGLQLARVQGIQAGDMEDGDEDEECWIGSDRLMIVQAPAVLAGIPGDHSRRSNEEIKCIRVNYWSPAPWESIRSEKRSPRQERSWALGRATPRRLGGWEAGSESRQHVNRQRSETTTVCCSVLFVWRRRYGSPIAAAKTLNKEDSGRAVNSPPSSY